MRGSAITDEYRDNLFKAQTAVDEADRELKRAKTNLFAVQRAIAIHYIGEVRRFKFSEDYSVVVEDINTVSGPGIPEREKGFI